MTDGDPRTEELETAQAERARTERELADEAEQPGEEHAHERRAEKARYLREQLGEQRRADEDA